MGANIANMSKKVIKALSKSADSGIDDMAVSASRSITKSLKSNVDEIYEVGEKKLSYGQLNDQVKEIGSMIKSKSYESSSGIRELTEDQIEGLKNGDIMTQFRKANKDIINKRQNILQNDDIQGAINYTQFNDNGISSSIKNNINNTNYSSKDYKSSDLYKDVAEEDIKKVGVFNKQYAMDTENINRELQKLSSFEGKDKIVSQAIEEKLRVVNGNISDLNPTQMRKLSTSTKENYLNRRVKEVGITPDKLTGNSKKLYNNSVERIKNSEINAAGIDSSLKEVISSRDRHQKTDLQKLINTKENNALKDLPIEEAAKRIGYKGNLDSKDFESAKSNYIYEREQNPNFIDKLQNKKVPQIATGIGTTAWMVSRMSESKGEMSNQQLYGQKPY